MDGLKHLYDRLNFKIKRNFGSYDKKKINL